MQSSNGGLLRWLRHVDHSQHGRSECSFREAVTPSRIAVANPREFREILDLFPVVALRVYLMTQARREFLADLARAHRAETFNLLTSEPFNQLTSDLTDYPAHLPV